MGGGGGGLGGAAANSLNLLCVRFIEKKLKFNMLKQLGLLDFAKIKFKTPDHV